MSKLDHYDNALMGILQNEGQITNFLDIFFSFLFRKTDFYRLMLHPKDNYGFMPGVSKKLVLSAFKKYEAMAAVRNDLLKKEYEDKLRKEKEETSVLETIAAEETITTITNTATTTSTVTTTTSTATITNSVNQQTTSTTATKAEDVTTTTTTLASEPQETQLQASLPQSTTHSTSRQLSQEIADANKSDTTTTTTATINDVTATTSTASSTKPYNPDDDPELEKQQQQFQVRAESYNGAARQNYSWSQSITDLDVYVKVPAHIKKGKDVNVVVQKKHLKVSYKDEHREIGGGGGGGGEERTRGEGVVVVVDDDFCWPIHAGQVTWTLEPGLLVHISMEKIQERWWDGLLLAEPKISIRKIDNSRPITDLDNEAQAKVEEMMFNERQKKMGLPQSHELKMHDVLKQAWDVEGSPFKGQPFDPSVINFSQPPMQ